MRTNTSRILGWLVPGLGALAVAGGLLVWQWPPGEPETTHAESDTARIDEVRTTTADLVDIRSARDGVGGLQVTLHIAEGWHVNANPASLDFLIPTEITASADNPLPLQVDYPPGRRIDSGLGEPWAVYDDGTSIPVVLPGNNTDDPLNVAVRVQACHDEGRCLPPATLRERLDSGTSP